MNNPIITLEFPPEAAEKIADFKSGQGEKAWNDVLRNIDNFIGVLPLSIKTQGVPGNPALATRVHAGT
jgi:hypothetical protein